MIQSKIQIAYLISSLTQQGPVQVLMDIVTHMDWSKFEVTIIVLKKEEDNSLQALFEALPIKIVRLNKASKCNLLGLLKQVKGVVEKENIQIVHSHCFRSLVLNSMLGKLVSSFHTIHNNPTNLNKVKNGVVVGTLIIIATKFSIRRIEFPIACSKSVAEELKIEANIFAQPITNGITVKTLECRNKMALRKSLDLDPNLRYFISVGRFSPEKNFKMLVQSFIDASLEGAKLIILGEGNTLQEVKDLSDENIILPGFKTNVEDYLGASDFYISLSKTEGMPLSVLEAMSHGLPLLLSDIPPHREIFETVSNREIGKLISLVPATNSSDILHSAYNMNNFHSEIIQHEFKKYFTSERMSKEYQVYYLKAVLH